MANILSKTGILPGTAVQAPYVSQSIDAFTGIVPYDLTLNGNFNIIGVIDTSALGGINGSFTGSLSSTASYATTASHTNKISNPVSWSLYATSASYSEGVLSNNIPTSLIPISKPNSIIAGTGLILVDSYNYIVYSPLLIGKTLNDSVWVTLLQRAPYPTLSPLSNFESTCVVASTLNGGSLTFSLLSNGPANVDLIFDFIIMVQQ